MEEIQFYSYREAEEYLHLKFPIISELNGDNIYGIESIKLITDTDSYNYEVHNFKKIYVVGCGPKSGPGHPCAHQSVLDQTLILITEKNHNPIHIFHETGTGKIIYRGIYQINGISRKLTHAGWVYTEIELIKYKQKKSI
jgi:hypothetical protein